jgi:hypothetical protein
MELLFVFRALVAMENVFVKFAFTKPCANVSEKINIFYQITKCFLPFRNILPKISEGEFSCS